MPIDGSSSSSSFGFGHQRAADREHLLLAADIVPAFCFSRSSEARETGRTPR
jgi:hypothetical protein